MTLKSGASRNGKTVTVKTSMYWVYILLCSDNTLYTGSTPRLQRRIREHNEGKGAKYTRGRRPVVLLQAWAVETRSYALRLEAFIKSLSRQEKEQLITEPKQLLLLAKEKGYSFVIKVEEVWEAGYLVNTSANKLS